MPGQAFHMYVTAQEDDRIVRFLMDPETGDLTPNGHIDTEGGPAPMAFNPSKTALYMGHRGHGGPEAQVGTSLPEFGLSSWVIDRATGDLRQTGRVQMPGEPCFISTDRNGRFLLSAYYQAGACAVHGLDASGVLAERIEYIETNPGAHCLQTDHSNRFAFLPHISRNGPGLKRLPEHRRTALNAILQWRFDEQTGHLTPNEPYRLDAPEDFGPRHYAWHPTKEIMYVSNEQHGSVSVYRLDPERGTLTRGQTISTLPEDWTGQRSCADIQVTPNGRFVYAPNRGHNSIASFAIDESTGDLTATGRAEADDTPRAFGIDPTGTFLYAAGLFVGTITGYRIDQQDGSLTRLKTYEVGRLPMWVLIADFGA